MKSSTVGGVDQVDVTPELVSAVSLSLSLSLSFYFFRSLPSVKTEAEGLVVPGLSDRRGVSVRVSRYPIVSI